MQDGSAQLGSVKVGSTQATFHEWLCATGSVQVGSARVCSAQCALHELRRAISHSCIVPGCCAQVPLCKLLHASALCKLLCASALSKLLCASCSVQALCACALCKLVCASCSPQVLCASALCKLLCASCSAQVALSKCCRSCGNVLRVLFFVLKSCDFPAGAAGVCSAYYVCT